jgi:hypothetical protein
MFLTGGFMDIVEMIKQCKSDEELKQLAKSAIDTFTKQAYRENKDRKYIGTELDINPINYHLDDPNFVVERYYDAVPIWNGYIPLGTKIVYGRNYIDRFKTSSHGGCYYYVDDDSYVYEFFKYIKETDILDEYDIVIEAFNFINDKLIKMFEPKSRDDINRLILKSEDLYFRPVKEHSIKNFYENGSALCSEISLLAENLISALGLEIMYFMDKEHVYNIFVFHNDDKTEINVLDFSNWVECYDINYNFVGKAPYIMEIKGADKNTIDAIVNEGKRIELPDYYLLLINDDTYEIIRNSKRNYGIDCAFEEAKTLVLNRK